MVYSIDTDGYINVLFPYDCNDDGFLRGGRTYRIVSGEEDGYLADGSKGVAYLRAVASATPIRRLYWPGCPGYERYAGQVDWSSFADYWGPALPPQIYGDPYVAMQSIDEFICWDSVNSGAVSIDYTYYYVMETVEKPVYFVRTGWRWPHTWYWPCSDIYWNVCWDACWGTGWSVSVGLGSWYPSCYPYTWSWCAPTWCAPSWCYPRWYRPRYAYCGPRTICCNTGACGSCSKCTGSTCRTYPSQTKYKRGEYAAGGSVSAKKARTGEATREYGLYTRADGSRAKSKRLATGEDREGLKRVRRVSDDGTGEPRESAAKSKTSRKLYSTEGRKPAGKKARPVEVEDAERKPASRKSYKSSDSDSKSRKAVSDKKSSSDRTSNKKSSKKTSTRTKVSGSSKTVRSQPARASKSSSSSSGSSRNHRGSPKTRRSVSR
jgi:hypothetical protein